MELLTRNNFEDWMQKLMERLDRQDELLLSLRPVSYTHLDVYKRQEVVPKSNVAFETGCPIRTP